jgi:ligand-binding SRPBCC domain-containing protein
VPEVPPPTFSIGFERLGFLSWRLSARQLLPLPPEEIFDFFLDPRNLSGLIPDWLQFDLAGAAAHLTVFDGAEFDYTIRWFGLRLKWRSRIVDFRPPERFTDIQLAGPYRFWRHLHTFDPAPEGTILGEEVVYRIPVEATLVERLINRQLEEIFIYRAARIAAWAASAQTRPAGT